MKLRKRSMKRSLRRRKRSLRRRRKRLKHLPLSLPPRTAKLAEVVGLTVVAKMLRTLLQAMILDLVLKTNLMRKPSPRKPKRRRRQRRKPRRRKLLVPIPPTLTLVQVQALIKMMIVTLKMMITRRKRILELAKVRVVVTVAMIMKSHLTRTWSRIPMLRRILRKLQRLLRLQ